MDRKEFLLQETDGYDFESFTMLKPTQKEARRTKC